LPAPYTQTTRALAGATGHGALLAWAAAALGMAAWAAWCLLGRVTMWEVSPQARLEVRQAAHPVAALLPGRIVATSLQLGRTVQAGDVLVELDGGAEALRLREAEARQRSLDSQLATLTREAEARQQAAGQDEQAATAAGQAAQLRLQDAGAAAGFAAEQARRLADEAQAGGVALAEAQQAQADARRLAAARDALAADLRRLQADQAARAADQRAAVQALQRQRATLEGERAAASGLQARLQLDAEHQRVRAPVAGRIADVLPLRVGDVLAAGQKLATIVPDGDFIIAADFAPAAVLGRIRPGQPAVMRLAGFPWAQYGTLQASVARVAGEVRDQHVRVEFTPIGPLPAGLALQHGLPGSVEVAVDRLAPATLLLRTAGLWLAGAPVAPVAPQ